MSTQSSSFVDSLAGVESFVAAISNLPTHPPSLYVDLEGTKLSRHGSISIIQVHVATTKHTYLLDVVTLQESLFTIKAPRSQMTWKAILEDPMTPKAFFDCRNDTDALFAHYSVSVRGIHDVQLMEVAQRAWGRTHVNGLAKCVERDLEMSTAQRARWMAVKDRGRRLFDPKLGGSYEVFARRPLPRENTMYCVEDANILPQLWQVYRPRLSTATFVDMQRESAWRAERSKAADYQPEGLNRALSLWPWTKDEPPCSRGAFPIDRLPIQDTIHHSTARKTPLSIWDASPYDIFGDDEPPDFDFDALDLEDGLEDEWDWDDSPTNSRDV